MKEIIFAFLSITMILCVSCGETADREETEEEWGSEKEEITTVPGQPRSEPVKVMIRSREPYGPYLTDGHGRAMYIFTADSAGKRACVGECAKAWPPVITSGKPVIGDGVDQELVARIRLETGEYQVAYADQPLYYYAKDEAEGDTKGQDIESFGGEWYLIGPEGRVIEGQEL